MALPTPAFTFEFHIGEIVVSTAGFLLWRMAKQIHSLAKQFIDRVEQVERTLDHHAEVVDMHSRLFMKLTGPKHKFEKLSKTHNHPTPTEYVDALD